MPASEQGVRPGDIDTENDPSRTPEDFGRVATVDLGRGQLSEQVDHADENAGFTRVDSGPSHHSEDEALDNK